MRKHLMAGTALAAATMLVAGGALAADKKMMKPSITVNGYFESIVGGIIDETIEHKVSNQMSGTLIAAATFDDPASALTAGTTAVEGTKTTDASKDTSALDTRTDAEIHFNGRATLDSGMKIHARVELEGQNHHSGATNGGDPIDEYFLSVSGSFGRIILGGTGGAPVKMLTGLIGLWATGVGETLNFDDAWVPSAGGNHYGLQHARLDTGDAEKMTYISPKLGGFQLGVTYSPNRVNNDGNGRIDTEAAGAYDGIEGAVSYTGKFGDVGFGVGAGMTSYQGCDGPKSRCDDTAKSDWLAAARIDFGGGFRVAIGHKQVTDDKKANESSLTDAGVRFIQGANSFSLVGSHGEMENTDASHTAVMGSYARALGPGVKWHANVIWNDSQSAKHKVVSMGVDNSDTLDPKSGYTVAPANEFTDTATEGIRKAEKSGIALVTGIKVVF